MVGFASCKPADALVTFDNDVMSLPVFAGQFVCVLVDRKAQKVICECSRNF